MDVVYLVREGDNPELRYSLRSLANVDHDTVWIVGYKPKWVVNVEPLPMRQTSDKWSNTLASVMAACTYPDISESFQLWNDDFFALEPTTVPVWHKGPMPPSRRTGNSATYRDGREATRRLLESWGVDPVLDYTVHVPMVIDRQKMADVIRRASSEKRIRALSRRTLYGNAYQIGGTHVKDVSISNRRDVWKPGQQWVSTTDKTFNHGNVGAAIRELFPDPSPYEGDQ